jgi:iron complex transport system substrate-binding protein
MFRGPKRIVCLTEEPTEILYLLGEDARIVGISAYTERPARAREEKPVVSAFVGGSIRRIAALEPDLVIGFSDIQAELAKQLIAENLSVLIFNQRSLQEILDVIVAVGSLVHQQARAIALAEQYQARLEALSAKGRSHAERPRVYFEEWDEPMISGIQWVSELIDFAGGRDIFADRAGGKRASDRFVQPSEVLERDPEVVFASWCGKPFDRDRFVSRPGFRDLSAVKTGRVFEVPPSIILQPGPACLTDGLDFLARHLAQR